MSTVQTAVTESRMPSASTSRYALCDWLNLADNDL